MYTFKQYRTEKNNSGSAKAALEFGFLWLSFMMTFTHMGSLMPRRRARRGLAHIWFALLP